MDKLISKKVDDFLDKIENKNSKLDSEEVEINNEKLTREDIEKNVFEAADNLLNNAQELLNMGDTWIPDSEYINNNKQFFGDFLNYSLPSQESEQIDLKQFICSITNYKYDPRSYINSSILHSVQDRVIYIYKLSKIFNYQFVKKVDMHYNFSNTEDTILEFVSTKNYSRTVFEYNTIKSMLGKIMICASSVIELAFKKNFSTLNKVSLSVLKEIIDPVNNLLKKSDKKIYKSWKVFTSSLLSVGQNKYIYNFKNNSELTEKLLDCYNNDFILESLVGNTLKCYFPTIMIDYIEAIKIIYLFGRLITIYIHDKLYENKTLMEIENDIYAITQCMVISYETKYYKSAMIPRAFPKCENNTEMSEEFRIYYASHSIVGPVYYLLNQLSLSITSILPNKLYNEKL